MPIKILFRMCRPIWYTRQFGAGNAHRHKVISVISRGGPRGCETSKLPHFLDNRLTDGGEVVNLRAGRIFTLRKIPGTDIC
jgi:hypothetical protein